MGGWEGGIPAVPCVSRDGSRFTYSYRFIFSLVMIECYNIDIYLKMSTEWFKNAYLSLKLQKEQQLHLKNNNLDSHLRLDAC